MSKANLILIGLAVVQLVLVLVTGGDGSSAAPATGGGAEKPFGTVDLANVGRIEITDDEGKTIAVQRVPGTEGKDDTWGLATKDGFPVRSSEVTTAVGAVNKLVRGRLVTRQKKNLTGLGVSDDRFSRHVVVKDKAGGTIADFYLGEGRQSDQVFFRKAGEEAAWHATGANTYELSPNASSWVDTTFTDINFDDVVKVKIERESGTIEVARQERPKAGAEKKDEPGKGAPDAPKDGEKKDGGATGTEPGKEGQEAPKEGEKKDEPTTAPPKVETETVWVLTFPETKDLDKSKTESWVRGFCRLYLSEPVGKEDKEEYGLQKPTASAVLTLKDGAVRTITVGKKREKENDFFARRSGFDYVVTIRSYSIDDFFQKKLDDLLPEKKPEEPAPAEVPKIEPPKEGGAEKK